MPLKEGEIPNYVWSPINVFPQYDFFKICTSLFWHPTRFEMVMTDISFVLSFFLFLWGVLQKRAVDSVHYARYCTVLFKLLRRTYTITWYYAFAKLYCPICTDWRAPPHCSCRSLAGKKAIKVAQFHTTISGQSHPPRTTFVGECR